MSYVVKHRIPVVILALAAIQLLILSMYATGSFEVATLSLNDGAAQLANALSISVGAAAGLIAGASVLFATGQVWAIAALLGVGIGFAIALVSVWINEGFWAAAGM